MTLIPARLKNEYLLEEIEQFAQDDRHFHLWWLGQSGYLLLWKGKKVLIDPYLSDSLTVKYADTEKPHIRMSEIVIDPALLTDISIVTSSHNHTDHLDGITLKAVLENNPGVRLIIPEANRAFVAARLNISEDLPTGLDAGAAVRFGDFEFQGVPASHNEIEKDSMGRCKYLGYIIRFGDWTLYHSGDTLLYDGMVETLRPFSVDLAILPINGNDASRGVAGNLNGEEAAALGHAIGARMVIPCHYDMFTFNTADPAGFAREAGRLGLPYQILVPGGHFTSESLGE